MVTLLLVHVAATLFMVGVIWFVQVVHYPLLGERPPQDFARFQARNVRLTTLVVAPAMLVEATTALALVVLPGSPMPRSLGLLGLVLLVVVWTSTALLQVPCHRILERGLDTSAHRRLVRSSWLRTLGWTARGILVLVILGDGITAP